jgi:hypothetical protein
MAQEKIYIGLVKAKQTQYGEVLKVSLSPEHIEALNAEFARKNGGWVNLEIKQRREPSPKGYTHSMALDQWEPKVEPKQDMFNDARRVVIPGEEEVF